ncbi:MAG: hypothetical protein AAGH15_00990 [Myxococcota bacterium]
MSESNAPSRIVHGTTAASARLVAFLTLCLAACTGNLHTHDSGDGMVTVPPTDGGDLDGGGGTTDGGRDAGTAPDAGMRPDMGFPAGDVPVFLAFGHAGRTVLSCDHGATWIADRSDEPSLRCYEGGQDCDHRTNAGMDVVVTPAGFFRTLGWGPSGGVDRSTDGIRWSRVQTETSWSSLLYGNGYLIGTGGWSSTRSNDGGASFEDFDTGLHTTSRSGVFYDFGGGRFLNYGDSDVVFSDDGLSWTVRRGVIPGACSGPRETMVAGGGVALIYGNGGICRSTDGGERWSVVYDGGVVSSALWTGTRFEAWTDGERLVSTDGASWSGTALAPRFPVGPVGRSDDGRYVAVEQAFDGYYERQGMRTSDDGVTWTEASSFTGGHPLRKIVFTRLAACPSP